MTTQLNFSASANPLSALVGAGLADAKAAPGAGDTVGGSHFAELFTGHMLKLERQGLAAAEDAFSSLQVMPLGPGINVITSDAPVPDIQSLLAFAKAQGLDEAAVAGLFGDMPAMVRSADGLSPGGLQGLAVPTVPASAPSLSPSPTLGMLQAVPGVSILGLEIAPKPASADVLPSASAADVLASLGVSMAKDGDQRIRDASTVAQPGVAAPELAPPAAVLLALQTVAAAVKPSAIPASAIDNHGEPTPPMVDALRVQMGIPGEDITRRLAQLSGMHGAVTWAELVAHAGAERAQISTPVAGDGAAQGAADASGRATAPRAAATAPRAAASALGAGPDAALALAPLPLAQVALAGAPDRAIVPGTVAASRGADPQVALAPASLPAANGAAAAAAADRLGVATIAAAQVPLTARSPLVQAGLDASPRPPPEEEALIVDLPPGLDLADLSDQAGMATTEAGGARHAERSAGPAPNAQSAADATRAAIQERAAQTQLLADRMGQAMANKLISQIERGQWKMQMRLQPGALGRVEVALDMHAGGLDAVFSTDNALTKELLGQGANRLREALTQTGTTVASVTVNADARGQSGGNSTPQKRQPSPQQTEVPMPVGAIAAKGGRYTGAVAEGLNVLA